MGDLIQLPINQADQTVRLAEIADALGVDMLDVLELICWQQGHQTARPVILATLKVRDHARKAIEGMYSNLMADLDGMDDPA